MLGLDPSVERSLPNGFTWLLSAIARTIRALLSTEEQDSSDTVSTSAPLVSDPGWLDQEAIVTETIQPRRSGRVRFQGSWWSARCDREVVLLPNTVVYVLRRVNLTLIVEPK